MQFNLVEAPTSTKSQVPDLSANLLSYICSSPAFLLFQCRPLSCMLLTSSIYIPFMAWQTTGYTSTKHSSPPATNSSTIAPQSSHFNNNPSHPRSFQYRANRSMTFNSWFTCFLRVTGIFFFILSAVHCESSRLSKMHKLLRKRRQFTCFIVRFPIFSEIASGMTLRSFRHLEVIRPHPMLLHAKLYHPRVNDSRVTCYAYGLFT